MIVCSRCQFENPVHHRFCQKCGELLIQTTASTPDAESAEDCLDTIDPEGDGSGADVHPTLHQTIVQPDVKADSEDPSPANIKELMSPVNTIPSEQGIDDDVKRLAIVTSGSNRLPFSHQATPSSSQDQYLDKANRYWIVTPYTAEQDGAPLESLVESLDQLELLVIDSQPDTPPYLEQDGMPTENEAAWASAPVETQIQTPEISLPLTDTIASTREHGNNVSEESRELSLSLPLATPAHSTPSVKLPLVAQDPKSSSTGSKFWRLEVNMVNPNQGLQMIRTYFELQEQLYPSFPRLVDAWDEDKAVVVLENRSDLSLLREAVVEPNVVPPQILHWCHEMTELWEVLSTHQCCQSLLNLDNVRLDEDHILCLRRLYFDQELGQYTLKDLGQLWQRLFSLNQAPAQTPAQAPAQTPAQAPAQTPAQAPAQTPAQAPAQTPAQSTDQSTELKKSPDTPNQDDQDLETSKTGKLAICPEALVAIYQDLESGAIADLDALRLRLEAAADQIHQSALSAVPLDGARQFGGLPDGMEGPNRMDGLDGIDRLNNKNSTRIQAVANAEDDSDISDDMSILPEQQSSMDWDEAQYEDTPPGAIGMGDDPTIVLPMQLHTLSNAGLTNIGVQRDHNEDCFSMDTQIQTSDVPSGRVCNAKGLYILCDGMGGHAAGEVASAAAVESLQTYFQEHWTDELPDVDTINQGIIEANQRIYEQNQADESEGARRMGTTLVMLLVQNTKAIIAHVGDSRGYRFSRRQGLEQLTVDHEVGQREIARGVAEDVAYARPDAYQLTQALGPRDREFVRPDIRYIDISEDSLFVLGSDGLTDNELLETYCESHVEPLISTNANLDEGVDNLIDLSNQVNGHDNITVLVVRVKLRPKLAALHR